MNKVLNIVAAAISIPFGIVAGIFMWGFCGGVAAILLGALSAVALAVAILWSLRDLVIALQSGRFRFEDLYILIFIALYFLVTTLGALGIAIAVPSTLFLVVRTIYKILDRSDAKNSTVTNFVLSMSASPAAETPPESPTQQALQDYLSKAIAKGIREDQILERLQAEGWEMTEIQKAQEFVSSHSTASQG